jgi:hypothetical protein
MGMCTLSGGYKGCQSWKGHPVHYINDVVLGPFHFCQSRFSMAMLPQWFRQSGDAGDGSGRTHGVDHGARRDFGGESAY